MIFHDNLILILIDPGFLPSIFLTLFFSVGLPHHRMMISEPSTVTWWFLVIGGTPSYAWWLCRGKCHRKCHLEMKPINRATPNHHQPFGIFPNIDNIQFCVPPWRAGNPPISIIVTNNITILWKYMKMDDENGTTMTMEIPIDMII